MGEEDATTVSIRAMQAEIATLKDALRLTEAYKRDMATAAQQVLLNDPLVKWGKWFLGLAITIGLVIWLGGSIYQGIQVKSIDARTAEMEQQIDKKLGERTKAIDERAAEAKGAIEGKQTEVTNAAKTATDFAIAQQKLVRDKLAVDELPNIRQLEPQLKALADSGGRLNLRCLSLLSGWSVWVLFSAAGLSLLLSLYAVFRMHW